MAEPGDPPGDIVRIDGNGLTIEKVVRVAREGAKAELAPAAKKRMKESRDSLMELIDSGRIIYAVNTGVGELVDVKIHPDELKQLQVNLLRSHACGVGEPFPAEVARAMLLLRA